MLEDGGWRMEEEVILRSVCRDDEMISSSYLYLIEILLSNDSVTLTSLGILKFSRVDFAAMCYVFFFLAFCLLDMSY